MSVGIVDLGCIVDVPHKNESGRDVNEKFCSEKVNLLLRSIPFQRNSSSWCALFGDFAAKQTLRRPNRTAV